MGRCGGGDGVLCIDMQHTGKCAVAKQLATLFLHLYVVHGIKFMGGCVLVVLQAEQQ